MQGKMLFKKYSIEKGKKPKEFFVKADEVIVFYLPVSYKQKHQI